MTARQGTTVSEVLDALRVATTEGAPVALATVVDVRGAAPARVGFKILVRADGTAVGNVGTACSNGGCVKMPLQPWSTVARVWPSIVSRNQGRTPSGCSVAGR